MEWHRIIDFGFDPRQPAVWVHLDGAPSPAWRSLVCQPAVVADGVLIARGTDRLPAAKVAGEWLYLDASRIEELDAFTVLSASVHRANAMIGHAATMSRSHRHHLGREAE